MPHVKRLVGMLMFLLLWEGVVRSGAISPDYMPHLATIGSALAALLANTETWGHLALTWQRMGVGLAGALAIGLGLAALTARYAFVRRMLSPLVEMLRSLPPPALVPLVIFIVGADAGLFYFIVVFAAIWPIYLGASNALATAEPVQLNTARSLGLTDSQTLWHIRIPAAMPEIMSGVRIGAGIALLAGVATEMLIGGSGIGYLVYEAGFSMLMPRMYALLFIVGASGVALNLALGLVSRWLVGWQIRWSAMGEMA